MEQSKTRTMTSWLKDISIPTYILIMLFAISSWIDINGVWVELPILVNELPEGWNLPSYLVIIIQIANIGPLLYTIGHKMAPNRVHEAPGVFVIIGIGAISTLLLVHLWDRTSYILGTEHSTALFTLTGFLSLVDCTSSVVYLPYMQRFKTQYMTALYIGEDFSGLIPGLVGLAQGVGGNPRCVNHSVIVNSSSTGTNTTEWNVYPVYPAPRFSIEAFFWFLFAMLCVSGLAFTLLHYLPYCKRAYTQDSNPQPAVTFLNGTDNYEAVESKGIIQANDDVVNYEPCNSQDGVSTALTGQPGAESTEAVVASDTHMWYLLILTAWMCALTNGVLPATQTYSCLPYGYVAYTLAVRVSKVVNPLVCFLTLFLPAVTVTVLSVLVAIASALAIYLLCLAALSPTPPLQGHVIGVVLVVSSSVLMTALFSYAKLAIAIMLRDSGGHRALLWCGVVTQIGSLCGAVCTFIVVSVLDLLQSMDPCATV